MTDRTMNDEEFLRYCDTHSYTERCGFVPEHIARLARLAGEDDVAKAWDEKPLNVHNMDGNEIRDFVERARTRLSVQPTV